MVGLLGPVPVGSEPAATLSMLLSEESRCLSMWEKIVTELISPSDSIQIWGFLRTLDYRCLRKSEKATKRGLC